MDVVDDLKIERNTFKGGSRGIGGLEYARCNTHQAALKLGGSSKKTNVSIRDNKYEMLPELQCGHGITVENAHNLSVVNDYLPKQAISIRSCSGITESGNTASSALLK